MHDCETSTYLVFKNSFVLSSTKIHKQHIPTFVYIYYFQPHCIHTLIWWEQKRSKCNR